MFLFLSLLHYRQKATDEKLDASGVAWTVSAGAKKHSFVQEAAIIYCPTSHAHFH